MSNDCNKCKGSTPFGFIIISGFFLLWMLMSIIPGLGIIGDLLFRFMVDIPFFDFTLPKWHGIGKFGINILLYPLRVIGAFLFAILEYLLDMIPIIGPIINFLHFWIKGYF